MSESPSSFPKRVRLLKPDEFKWVFERPLKYSGPGFLVLARANEQGFARLGLAISKKCSKSAVERNRIKRLAREGFRMVRGDLPAADFVVVCRSGSAGQSNRHIAEVVSGLFSKLGRRICEKS